MLIMVTLKKEEKVMKEYKKPILTVTDPEINEYLCAGSDLSTGSEKNWSDLEEEI